jgi:hypothetical protein
MECCSVNTIAIVQQITQGAIPWKCFSDLPGRPFGCRMRGHVEVNGATPAIGQDYEYKQQAKAHRRPPTGNQ